MARGARSLRCEACENARDLAASGALRVPRKFPLTKHHPTGSDDEFSVSASRYVPALPFASGCWLSALRPPLACASDGFPASSNCLSRRLASAEHYHSLPKTGCAACPTSRLAVPLLPYRLAVCRTLCLLNPCGFASSESLRLPPCYDRRRTLKLLPNFHRPAGPADESPTFCASPHSRVFRLTRLAPCLTWRVGLRLNAPCPRSGIPAVHRPLHLPAWQEMLASKSLPGYQLSGLCAYSICECKCKKWLKSVDFTRLGAVI